MKYKNAEKVLPERLLIEIQTYISGELLYIPNTREQKKWGEKSGSRMYYTERNSVMKKQYKEGKSMEQISRDFGLAFDTVRKIIYR